MGFNPIRKTVGGEKLSWLDSRHALSEAQSVTLNASAFPAGTFPNGIVPSGWPLAEVGGLAVPFNAAGTDGSQTCTGFNAYTRDVSNGNEPAALLDHGRVNTANLPAGAPVPTAAGNIVLV